MSSADLFATIAEIVKALNELSHASGHNSNYHHSTARQCEEDMTALEEQLQGGDLNRAREAATKLRKQVAATRWDDWDDWLKEKAETLSDKIEKSVVVLLEAKEAQVKLKAKEDSASQSSSSASATVSSLSSSSSTTTASPAISLEVAKLTL